MDQEKIGKFICKCRKEKKMTQKELGEKIGVTEKSISNWENGRNMPDLSLFKPLCKELDISIGDLINGEKIKEEEYKEKVEENIINTIYYTNKKVNNNNNKIGIFLIVLGVLLTLSAMGIFPSESSWGSIYSILGCIISLAGINKCIKKLSYGKRMICSLIYFILYISALLIIDYIGVIYVKEAPRFALIKISADNMIVYKAPFYNVYRINVDTKNEYYIIDTERKYTMETVPNIPFNREKAGIENIIKYKNKYIGNNSNLGGLINSLPLSEYSYVFEIDAKNLGVTIDYHITSWYIEEENYLEKSLIYNAVSIFSLIENVEYITFHFSGKSYSITRKKIEEKYPDYEKIDVLKKETFYKYVENKINDEAFIENTFQALF